MNNKKKKKKKPPIDPNIPKCPFCGRRITVKKVEDNLFDCSHCEKMFQLDKH